MPFAELLRRYLPEYGCQPEVALVDALALYLTLVSEAQARLRLVGSTDPEVLVRRHAGESLALLALRPLGAERFVDLGSGAGFPGLVLALARPVLKTTLVEATQKKAIFLRRAAAELGLSDRVEVVDRFIPRRPPDGERAPLAGATLVGVRALDHMEDVPSWLDRWLDPATQVAFWVNRERAEEWRRRHPAWRWGVFSPLPGACARGILLAAPPRP